MIDRGKVKLPHLNSGELLGTLTGTQPVDRPDSVGHSLHQRLLSDRLFGAGISPDRAFQI